MKEYFKNQPTKVVSEEKVKDMKSKTYYGEKFKSGDKFHYFLEFEPTGLETGNFIMRLCSHNEFDKLEKDFVYLETKIDTPVLKLRER